MHTLVDAARGVVLPAHTVKAWAMLLQVAPHEGE